MKEKIDVTNLKEYLLKGITGCVNKNVENDYIDMDDYEEFYNTLESKILIIDKLSDEDKSDLMVTVNYIMNLSDVSDSVKYEMIISLPMLYNSFMAFSKFSLKYKSVVSSAAFMVEPEDVYEYCKVFLELEFADSLESVYSDFEDQVNFCGEVIEMVFNKQEFGMSNEENDRFLKEVLEILRRKYNESHKTSGENTNNLI